MSLVHDNLRREERQGTGPVVGEPLPTEEAPEAGLSDSDYTRDLARKQQLLIEGITRLQDTVDDLGRQLDEAHEENGRLRDLIRTQAGPARGPDAPKPQSLISQAME